MKAFTIFVVLLLSLITSAQTPIENKTLGIHFTPSPQIENTKDLETFIANLGKVELVYLEGNCQPIKSATSIENSSNEPCIRQTIIKGFDRINNVESWDSSFFSTKSRLKTEDLTTLTDILFGNKYQQAEIIGGIDKAGCYSPRNGIVFYNTQNVAIGFLEICFECHGFELTSEIPFMKSTITNEELKIFKSLFTKNGIRTTEKDVFEYNRFNLEFKTSKTVEEQEALTQFLNTVYRVEFVRLMGDCEYAKMNNTYKNDENCYFPSIIKNIEDSSFIVKKENFRQVVKVNKKDLPNLFQILYQENSPNNIYDLCYQPRNGIILYDKNNKPFAFIEICFECNEIKSTGSVPKINHPTSTVMKELNILFDEYGINTKEK